MIDIGKAAPYALFGGAGAFGADRFAAVYQTVGDGTASEKLTQALQAFPADLSQHPFAFSTSPVPLLACGGVLVAATLAYNMRDTNTYRFGEEYGSARWGTARERKRFAAKKKDFHKNIILGQGCYMNMEEGNNPLYARNNNVIVVGGSGAWKTTAYIMSNIAQMNASFVVTDPKGMTARRVGTMLEKYDYKVKVIDFDSLKNTDHFNPFAYVHDEITLQKVIKTLIDASNGQHAKKGEPFWDKAEEMLLSAMFAYLYYRYKGDGKIKGQGQIPCLADIGQMIRWLKKTGDEPSVLEIMFDDFAQEFGHNNYAVQLFENFKSYQGQTRASVVSIATARFAMFDIPQVKEFIKDDTLEIDKWIEEKYAVFLKIPDMGNTFDYLTTMIFLLAFRRLEERVDNEFDGEAPVPVRFLMDEFANLGVIPNIEEALSVLRSRRISIEIILQNINQLNKFYKDVQKSFFGNCDSVVYLAGSTEEETQKYFSQNAGKQTIFTKERDKGRVIKRPMARDLIDYAEVALLPRTQELVRISSSHYFRIPKYNYKKHPRAKEFSNNPRDGKWYFYKRYKNDLEMLEANVKAAKEAGKKITTTRLSYDNVAQELFKPKTFKSFNQLQKG